MAQKNYMALAEQKKSGKFDTSLGAWLDRLMRTNYAMANLAKDAIDGGDFTPIESIWGGLKGEDKTLFGDVMSEAGWEPSSKPEEVAKFMVSFGTDVLLDPSTYLGVGGLTKVGKLAAKMGKLAPTLEKQAQTGQCALVQFAGRDIIKGGPVLEKIGQAGEKAREFPVVDWIGKAFVPHFRPAGVDPEIWGKLVEAQKAAKNIERLGTDRARDFAQGVKRDIKELTKKGAFDDEDAATVLEAIEKNVFGASLPEKVQPLYKKLDAFRTNIAKEREALGKANITDEDYSYWLHTLSDGEKALAKKTGFDVAARLYTTKSASDLNRQILKFRSLDDPIKTTIGKASDMGLVPLSVKGIDEPHLQEMFASTIKDLVDLENVAKQYGISVKFTPNTMTYGRALGLWDPSKRTMRIATGGRNQKDFMSTVAHELAHVVHGELGAYDALSTLSPKFVKNLGNVIPKNEWGKITEKIALLSNQAKDQIWRTLGTSRYALAQHWDYHNQPTEIFARFVQVMKNDPAKAREIAPELYDTTLGIFKDDVVSRKIRNIFLSPSELTRKPEFGYVGMSAPSVYKGINMPGFVHDGERGAWLYADAIKNNPERIAEVKNAAKEIDDKLAEMRKAGDEDAMELATYKSIVNHVVRAVDGKLIDTEKVAMQKAIAEEKAKEVFKAKEIFVNPKTGQVFNAKQATINEVNQNFNRQYFSTDLPWTSYVMGRRLAKQRAGYEFMGVAREIGSPVPIDGWVKSSANELKGFYFPEQVAKEIDKTVKAFTSEESTKGFLKLVDDFTETFKTTTLPYSLGYYFRNLIGNLWNNYLADVRGPAYKQAVEIQSKLMRKMDFGPEEKHILDLAVKHGVMGRSHGYIDLNKVAMAPRMEENLLQKISRPGGALLEKMGFIEDGSRLAHFIDRLNKGFDAPEAAMSTKKYLFDYDELTDFERNVMRRLFPFYTWTRKNIPLQLEALTSNPGRPMVLEKLRQENHRRIGNPPEEFLPEWIQERMPFFLSRQNRNQFNYFPIESWIPFADLMKVTPDRAKDIVGELLTPILKIPIELASNKIFYFNRPIEDYKGETEEFLRMDVPAWMSYLGRNVRVLNDINNLIGRGDIGPGAPPQPSVGQRITRWGTGVKLAKYDVQKAIKAKKYEIREELGKLKIGLSKAEKYGRRDEIIRISRRIDEAEQLMKRLD